MRQRAGKYTSTKRYLVDRFRTILLCTLLIATLSPHSTASAVQITLGWGPPADGSVVNGYRVYSRPEGQSYNYSQPRWQGTTTTCTIPDLQAVTTYFVARAYNSYGESTNSNEVTYRPSTPPANNPPAAVIDSITPNPATEVETVTFTGHGSDSDGSITGWRWSSSVDGTLSSGSGSCSTSDLSTGTHTISFQVQDDDGAWSTPATRSLTVNGTSQEVREVIVDNRDANTARTGTWEVSGGTSPFGADSVWARGGEDTLTWRFTPDQSGNYEVWEWHSGTSTRASAAPHRITHAGGSTTVSVNQRLNAGKWNSLGVYALTAGVRYEVRVTSVADSSSTCADAVRWTLVPSGVNNPPTAVIDSITPNPATAGQTVTFTGHCSDSDGSITGWRWSSSINGTFSTGSGSFSGSFARSDLSAGTHAISFQVQDDDGAWSTPATRSLTVNGTSQEVREVIVDNRDANTARTGSWAVSDGTSPFGANSVWARGGDDTFTWRFTPDQSGNYEVWEWHSGWSTRASAAPHRITHAGGSTTVSVNQKLNAGKWNSLGVYAFTAGVRYEVRVTSVADTSSTCADAMRWTLVP